MNAGDLIFALVYISRETRPLDAGEISKLLEVSRRNNARLGITGLLVHKSGHFLQILEGKRDEVERLMARIASDPRHRDVSVLMRDDGRARRFGQWSMAEADWPDEDAVTCAGWFDLMEGFRRQSAHFSPAGGLMDFACSLAERGHLR